ncbi:inositol monophosphatase [Candidatus Daviesbacteria bacterium]|nr:inositol monophosphatase [Candidatus Daviesbacteria bacterium]
MNDPKFLKIAKKAALEAGKIISKYYGEKHELNYKHEDRSDFATKADVEAEEKIVKILTKNFPNHNIIAEEKNRINKGSAYTWVIDPLDGSLFYIKGLSLFAVSIGLLQNNQPVLGVIYDVSAKNLYFAQKGKGAYLNDKPIAVSKEHDLEAAVVDMDFGHKARRLQKLESYIITLADKMGYLCALGPAVGILGLVAKGSLDAYVVTAWIWDFAAGVAIVKEAGGKVTDFEGKELDWSKDRLNIIASNGLIHDQILEALK